MESKEFSKNPNVAARVNCSQCSKEFDLAEALHERPMPIPFNTVVEGVITCPKCGYEKHSYYMPESLRFDQDQLKRAVIDWQTKRTNSAFREYKRRLGVFQRNFDRSQERYRKVFEKEAASGGEKV